MNLEESLVHNLRALPPQLQRKLVEYSQELLSSSENQAVRDPYGSCADLKESLSEEDIRQVRKEMWANFPREDI